MTHPYPPTPKPEDEPEGYVPPQTQQKSLAPHATALCNAVRNSPKNFGFTALVLDGWASDERATSSVCQALGGEFDGVVVDCGLPEVPLLDKTMEAAGSHDVVVVVNLHKRSSYTVPAFVLQAFLERYRHGPAVVVFRSYDELDSFGLRPTRVFQWPESEQPSTAPSKRRFRP